MNDNFIDAMAGTWVGFGLVLSGFGMVLSMVTRNPFSFFSCVLSGFAFFMVAFNYE